MANSQNLTENINNFIPTGFRLVLEKIPNVTYFCQAASLPGLSMGQATLVNPGTSSHRSEVEAASKLQVG